MQPDMLVTHSSNSPVTLQVEARLPQHEIQSIQRSYTLALACSQQMLAATQKLQEEMQQWEEENKALIQACQTRISASNLLLTQSRENEIKLSEQTQQSLESIQQTHTDTSQFLESCKDHKQQQMAAYSDTLKAEEVKIAQQAVEIQKLKAAINQLS